MRPDDHKKKKSAQYQKKHQKSHAAEGKGKAESGRKGEGKKEQKNDRSRREEAQKVAGKNLPSNLKESDTGSESDSDGPPARRTFQRRKVESNWNKYEETAVDLEQETRQREEEFQRLLTAKVSADAQFRLQCEQDWEDDLSQCDDSPDFLSIDCQELASAIQSIPLHQRLGIEELAEQAGVDRFGTQRGTTQRHNPNPSNAFQSKSYFKKSTESDSKNSGGSLTNMLSDLLKKEKQETPKSTLDFSIPKPKSEEIQVANHTWEEEESAKLTKPVEISHVTLKNDQDQMECVTKNPEEKEPQKPVDASKIKPEENDDELDFLLSLDKPVIGDAKKSDVKEKDAYSVSTDSLPTTNTLPEAEPREEKTQKPAAKKDQDLEEWLDSII